jgi:hypothetical protein
MTLNARTKTVRTFWRATDCGIFVWSTLFKFPLFFRLLNIYCEEWLPNIFFLMRLKPPLRQSYAILGFQHYGSVQIFTHIWSVKSHLMHILTINPLKRSGYFIYHQV